MRVKIKDIEKLLNDVLIKKGLNKKQAAIVADEYLSGELQGKKSHGLAAFLSYVAEGENDDVSFKVLKKTHASLYIDAQKTRGTLVGRFMADELMKMARREGSATGFIKNMKAWLRPGTTACT